MASAAPRANSSRIGSMNEGSALHEIDPATGLPVGLLVSGEAAAFPKATTLAGRYAGLEPLAAAHDEDLFAASFGVEAPALFRYLADEPPRSVSDVAVWRAGSDHAGTRVGWAIVDRTTGRAGGRLFLMRIHPEHRSIEVGNVLFGPSIARTRIATEALFLLMRHTFEDLRYRRFEWKCDALNAPSRRAAERFGFRFEGIFRRDLIVKGRSRDTAWYSIIDTEWPNLKAGYERWLAAENFQADGSQLTRLEEQLSGRDG